MVLLHRQWERARNLCPYNQFQSLKYAMKSLKQEPHSLHWKYNTLCIRIYISHSLIVLSVAPPVNENFTTDCIGQKEISRHISCEEDGSFSVVQCKGKTCHCVDTETGENLNGMRFDAKMRDMINCTGGR